MLIDDVTNQSGQVDIEVLAAILGTTASELSRTAGLDDLEEGDQKQRLRDVVEVMDEAVVCVSDAPEAYKWLKEQPFVGYNGETGFSLLRSGRKDLAIRHLQRIAAGVYT